MKKTQAIKLVLVGLIAAVALVACGEVAEFILDDKWELKEVQTDSGVELNTDDFVVIAFNSADSEANVTVGDSWPISFDPTGTYEYRVENADNVINFYQDDVLMHVVSYELENGYDTMIWNSWVAVEPTPDETIVSDSSTLRSLKFERVE
ncbi:MAG: hypothetical protein ACLFNT_03860 [Spirochaetales bacterium]